MLRAIWLFCTFHIFLCGNHFVSFLLIDYSKTFAEYFFRLFPEQQLLYSSWTTLKTVAASFSETSLYNYQSTRRYIIRDIFILDLLKTKHYGSCRRFKETSHVITQQASLIQSTLKQKIFCKIIFQLLYNYSPFYFKVKDETCLLFTKFAVSLK
jgi:hypothetical protein